MDSILNVVATDNPTRPEDDISFICPQPVAVQSTERENRQGEAMSHKRNTNADDGLSRKERAYLKEQGLYQKYLVWVVDRGLRPKSFSLFNSAMQASILRVKRDEREARSAFREDTSGRRKQHTKGKGRPDVREGDGVNANIHLLGTQVKRAMRQSEVRRLVSPVLLVEEVLFLIERVESERDTYTSASAVNDTEA